MLWVAGVQCSTVAVTHLRITMPTNRRFRHAVRSFMSNTIQRHAGKPLGDRKLRPEQLGGSCRVVTSHVQVLALPENTLPPPGRSSGRLRELEASSRDLPGFFQLPKRSCLHEIRVTLRYHNKLHIPHVQRRHADFRNDASRRRANMHGTFVVLAAPSQLTLRNIVYLWQHRLMKRRIFIFIFIFIVVRNLVSLLPGC